MNKKRILVVEDEGGMLELLTTELETSGYEVFQSSDGSDGLKEIQSLHPDLVVLDVMLPGMGGYEVCSRVKADQTVSGIPILMFSARAGDIDREIGLQCGANDYLAKPFDSEVFLDKVQKLI